MSYRPRTCSELNQFHIEKLLNKVKKGTIKKQDAARELNERFGKLQTQNIGMYEEFYPKYINLFKTL